MIPDYDVGDGPGGDVVEPYQGGIPDYLGRVPGYAACQAGDIYAFEMQVIYFSVHLKFLF
jgi:hypothetical protein